MDYDKAVRTEAENVLMSLGGVKLAKNAFTWFELDFDPTTAIQDIQLSGALPRSGSQRAQRHRG